MSYNNHAIQFLRSTSTPLSDSPYYLKQGQPFFNTTTGELKVGTEAEDTQNTDNKKIANTPNIASGKIIGQTTDAEDDGEGVFGVYGNKTVSNTNIYDLILYASQGPDSKGSIKIKNNLLPHGTQTIGSDTAEFSDGYF